MNTGIIDMCHRLLYGTPGTMANVPTANNANALQHVQQHIAVIRFK